MKSMNMAIGLAALVLSVPSTTTVFASETPRPTPVASENKAQEAAQPFKGTIEAVDQETSTLTVGGKQYAITADTKLSKQGKQVTFADLKVGESVRGIARHGEDGKLVATMVMLGAKDS